MDHQSPESPQIPETQPTEQQTVKLFVSNLPYKVRDEDIEHIFAEFGPLVSCAVQMSNEHMSRGFALVEFEQAEHAKTAMDALLGFRLMDREITVRLDMNVNDRPNRQNFQPRAGQAPRKVQAPRVQPPTQDFQRRRSAPAYGRQLFIGNLSFRTSWQDLKDAFREIGDVQRAEVFSEVRNGYKRSKGCGIVVMETEEAAQLAIEKLNGAPLGDRQIVVRLDAPPEDRPNFVVHATGDEAGSSPSSSPAIPAEVIVEEESQ